MKNYNCENNNKPTLRLNKAIAGFGICSRRKADVLIFAGSVTVNGKIEINPARQIFEDDIIEVNGRALQNRPAPLYLLMNKPIHCVCTVSDPQKRQTVMDYIPEKFKTSGLFPVGRLDYFSEGLLLMTNDGELAMRLTHPRYHQPKIYEVLIRGHVAAAALETMRQGMTVAGGKKLLPVEVKASHMENGDTILQMTLRQGINRQIRKMCAALDLTILKLRRIAAGCLHLGNLGNGETRLLSDAEVRQIKKETGLLR